MCHSRLLSNTTTRSVSILACVDMLFLAFHGNRRLQEERIGTWTNSQGVCRMTHAIELSHQILAGWLFVFIGIFSKFQIKFRLNLKCIREIQKLLN